MLFFQHVIFMLLKNMKITYLINMKTTYSINNMFSTQHGDVIFMFVICACYLLNMYIIYHIAFFTCAFKLFSRKSINKIHKIYE